MMWLSLLWDGRVISGEILSEWQSVLLGNLFQQKPRPAQEKRRMFPLCGIYHWLNVNIQSEPPESFLSLQFPNYKLSSLQEQRKPCSANRRIWRFQWGKTQAMQEHFLFEKSGINVLLKRGLFHNPLQMFASSVACASLLSYVGTTTHQAEPY